MRKIKVFKQILKFLSFLLFLYLFILSLGLLSDGFKVLSGTTLNDAIEEYQYLLNMPIVGLIAGILITVMVQSSSTSTSIMVSMVGAGLLTVEQAIYMIMVMDSKCSHILYYTVYYLHPYKVQI